MIFIHNNLKRFVQLISYVVVSTLLIFSLNVAGAATLFQIYKTCDYAQENYLTYVGDLIHQPEDSKLNEPFIKISNSTNCQNMISFNHTGLKVIVLKIEEAPIYENSAFSQVDDGNFISIVESLSSACTNTSTEFHTEYLVVKTIKNVMQGHMKDSHNSSVYASFNIEQSEYTFLNSLFNSSRLAVGKAKELIIPYTNTLLGINPESKIKLALLVNSEKDAVVGIKIFWGDSTDVKNIYLIHSHFNNWLTGNDTFHPMALEKPKRKALQAQVHDFQKEKRNTKENAISISKSVLSRHDHLPPSRAGNLDFGHENCAILTAETGGARKSMRAWSASDPKEHIYAEPVFKVSPHGSGPLSARKLSEDEYIDMKVNCKPADPQGTYFLPQVLLNDAKQLDESESHHLHILCQSVQSLPCSGSLEVSFPDKTGAFKKFLVSSAINSDKTGSTCKIYRLNSMTMD